MKPEELVGLRVAEFRERMGMTQQQLGEQMATYLGRPWSRQAVSAAEKGGRSFTATDLFALARALDTFPDRLLVPPPGVSTVEMPNGVALDGIDLGRWFTDRSYEQIRNAYEAVLGAAREAASRLQLDTAYAETFMNIAQILEATLESKAESQQEGTTDG